MEDIDPRITQAITHAAEAGKLRSYVRGNGDGLAGLVRLAERHSAAANAALDEIFSEAPERAEVRDQPGSQ